MKKRTLAMLLALCLVMSLFAACGAQEEASAPASVVEEVAEEPAPAEEAPADDAPVAEDSDFEG